MWFSKKAEKKTERKPKMITVVFDPKDDITPLEVARITPVIAWYGEEPHEVEASDFLSFQADRPNEARHFRIVEG